MGKDNTEYDFIDIAIERPHDFSVGRKNFRFYPVTLAKMFLLRQHVDGLSIDMNILKTNPYLEAIRVSREHRDVCCRILAYHTAPNTYKDLYDTKSIITRKNYFFEKLDDEDLASLMIYVLTFDKTEQIYKNIGIDKEREKLGKVMEIKCKHDRNNITFGGLTIFGTFIQRLKEIGYSDNEILFERGYVYLKFMLADRVSSVYLTDEERQELPTSMGGNFIDANDPSSVGELSAYLSTKGLHIN